MYLIRLDDACEYSMRENWERVLALLREFSVTSLIGIIPNCKSDDFIGVFAKDERFWEKALQWQNDGMLIAMHGFEHVYATISCGINPVQKRSEFAALSLQCQKEKIRSAYEIFQQRGIKPFAFFAPSHTFDKNTLQALKDETPIRVISDTIANDIYEDDDFYFLPVQSGRCRKLPFRFTTVALHPNIMTENDFEELHTFLKNHNHECLKINESLVLKKRRKSFYDNVLSFLYFSKRSVTGILRKR